MKYIYLLATLTAACALQMHAMGHMTMTIPAEHMAQAEEDGVRTIFRKFAIDAKPSSNGSVDVSVSHYLAVPALCARTAREREMQAQIEKDAMQVMSKLLSLASPEDLKKGADTFLDGLRNDEIPKIRLEFRPSKKDPALHLAVGCFQVTKQKDAFLLMLMLAGYADFDARNAQGETVFEYARRQAKATNHPELKDYFWEALEVLDEAKKTMAVLNAADSAAPAEPVAIAPSAPAAAQSPHDIAMAYLRQQVERAAQTGAGGQENVSALQTAMMILEINRQQPELDAGTAREQENVQKKEEEEKQ